MLYVLLTAGVVGTYLVIVAVSDAAVRTGLGLGSSVLATLLIAVAFNPIRVWLQRKVDRVIYGARRDPRKPWRQSALGSARWAVPTAADSQGLGGAGHRDALPVGSCGSPGCGDRLLRGPTGRPARHAAAPGR